MTQTTFPSRWSRLLPAMLLGLCGSSLLLAWRHGAFDAAPARPPAIPPCLLSSRECQQSSARIRLGADSLRPMQSTTITVVWPVLVSAQPLELRLEGKEMPMGIYKLRLEKEPSGSYQAELMLPFCTRNSMTWIGTIAAAPSERQPPLFVSLRMTQ